MLQKPDDRCSWVNYILKKFDAGNCFCEILDAITDYLSIGVSPLLLYV